MLKVTNLRLAIGEDENGLIQRCAKKLRIPVDEISEFRILRKSLDIRNKDRPEYVYAATLSVEDEKLLLCDSGLRGVMAYHLVRSEVPIPGDRSLEHRPVVVGAGPAGLFAAYLLAEHGYGPLVLERGRPVGRRVRDVQAFDAGGPHDPESNYLFGEGGAGTFSDGKLTCRNTGPDAIRVLQILAECKGKPSIVYESRPHLGSNRLPAVVKAIRRKIESFGGEFRFDCRVEDLRIEEGQLRGVHTSSGFLAAEVVVLAIGHSARDTYSMLYGRGVPLQSQPFQMGIRIEQPQEQVDRVQYGSRPWACLLGPADYTMKVHVGERDLFSFCMCAGGYVMASVSEPGFFCTNGMSRAGHESPFANSGLVVTVDPTTLRNTAPTGSQDDPLVGVRHQAAIEELAFRKTGGNYHTPIQWASDFLAHRPTKDLPPSSYRRGIQPMNLWELLPSDLAEVLADGLRIFDRRWNGLFLHDATLVGPESRGSAPVRIVRDPKSRQSIAVLGLYPIGEGAGYAGGIVSSAVDGLRTAKTIIAAHRPLGL